MGTLMQLDNVSKVYPRVHRPWERMQAFGSILRGREPAQGAEVLSDVSLEIIKGQSLGIIGENGAGKSTLLKILTGVIQPTRGTVEVNSSVAALLELGAGFQPDFSGLDNVRMKASLLGLSRAELDERMDRILSFADIGEYIHEPVKHYSSGMVVRLGFAVVTASTPEVLITDEVLAVGDESFQKKCIRWIEEFLGDGGTLLMVSHSMYIVQKLCHKALWLHDDKDDQNARLGMGEDLLTELVLYSPDGRPPVVHVGIIRIDGTPVYGVTSDTENARPSQIDENHYRFRLRFTSPGLLPGSYHMRGLAMDPEGLRVFDTQERIFQVNGQSIDVGIIHMPHEWVE
jgi:lipopolysaccharide transport system ATP-binding protein